MNKRRIITSALIGTIALVGLSVSLTLAWYGASDRLNMRSLDVVVAGQTNLKISDSSELSTFVSDLDLSPVEKEFVFVPVSFIPGNVVKVVTAGVLVAVAIVAATSRKLPLGLGGHAECPACHLVELGDKLLAVIP